MVKRTRETYQGKDQRNPANRWSRDLEEAVEDLGYAMQEMEKRVEGKIAAINEQLAEGKNTMVTLKHGQSILMSEMSTNTATCKRIEEKVGDFPELWRDMLGAKRIFAWTLAIIVAVSTAVIASINVVEKINKYQAPPVVQSPLQGPPGSMSTTPKGESK